MWLWAMEGMAKQKRANAKKWMALKERGFRARGGTSSSICIPLADKAEVVLSIRRARLKRLRNKGPSPAGIPEWHMQGLKPSYVFSHLRHD